MIITLKAIKTLISYPNLTQIFIDSSFLAFAGLGEDLV